MKKVFLLLIAITFLVILSGIFYIFLYNGVSVFPTTIKNDFQQISDSCTLDSDQYVVCCKRDNSITKCSDKQLLAGEPVVIKVSLSSISNSTSPYFLCLSENLYHPANQMPGYFTDRALFMDTQYGYSGNEKLLASYDSTKDIMSFMGCTNRLYPDKNYAITTFGFVPENTTVFEIIRNVTQSIRWKFMGIGKYPDGNYTDLQNFLSKVNSSETILSLSMEVAFR